VLRVLTKEKYPQGPVEMFLVESIALDMMRVRRARRLEAEYITGELNPPILKPDPLESLDFYQPTILDPGLPAAISSKSAQPLVNIHQRYESTFANRMMRNLHELERLQRMRKGEKLPAPAVVDVSVHSSASSSPEALEKPADSEIANSVSAALEQPKAMSGDVDADVHADTGVVDSNPAPLGAAESAARQ